MVGQTSQLHAKHVDCVEGVLDEEVARLWDGGGEEHGHRDLLAQHLLQGGGEGWRKGERGAREEGSERHRERGRERESEREREAHFI